MSDRERWIVYPLLFFALLLAAKDQIVEDKPVTVDYQEIVCGRLIANSIHCANLHTDSVAGHALEATDRDDNVRVRISGDVASGPLAEFYGDGGEPVVAIGSDETGRIGVVETKQAGGTVMVRLTANQFGGVMETVGPSGHPLIQLLGSDQGGQVLTHLPSEAEIPSEVKEDEKKERTD